MNKDTKIYIAGHKGLVGSAIWNNLLSRGYINLIGRTHQELDLLDAAAVKKIISIIDGKVITAVCDLAGVGGELVLVVVHLINRYIHMQQCAWKGRHRHLVSR